MCGEILLSFWAITLATDMQGSHNCEIDITEELKEKNNSIQQQKTGECSHEEPEDVDPDHLSQRFKSNWVLVVILIVAETESASQLSLPSVVASMGFVPGAILLTFFGFVAMYTGFLIADIWKQHPLVKNYDEVVGIHFGRVAKEVALWCQIIVLWCFLAANIMVSSQAFYIAADSRVCYTVFSIVVTVLGILLSIPRTLKGVAYFSTFAIIFIVIPEVMTLTGVAVQNVPGPGLPVGSSPNYSVALVSNMTNFLVAISDIIFAYSGHLLFFNLILEMGNPGDFKKAVFWGFLINIINYLIIGLGIYAYTGEYSQSPYILNLVTSSVKKAAYLWEVVNVLVSAMNYANLATKNVLRRFPKLKSISYKRTLWHWMGWMAMISVMWFIPWIAAEIIPVFNNLIGLAGALFCSQFTYGLPCILWIHSHWKDIKKGHHFLKTCWLVFIFIISIASLGLGAYGSINGIVTLKSQGEIASPFSCSEIP
eukprot:jgi/Galph1/1340/GphlegSOOS_G5946.1